jgi:transposase
LIHTGRFGSAMKYSEAFKAKMVQKMLGGRSANSVAQEAGSTSLPSRNGCETRTLRAVPKRKSEQEPRKSAERRPEDWSAEEKLLAVEQARALAGTELADFLRRQGLHEEQLRQWEQSALESLRGARRAKASTAESKRIKELERELRRKEKALAETAALLALRKKADALWGDEDASTETKSDDDSSN